MVWEVREELITIAFCFSPPLFFLGLISLFILLYSPSSIVLVFARDLIKNISQPQSQIRHYNNWQFVPPLTSRKEGHWVDEQIAHNRWKQMEGFFFFFPSKETQDFLCRPSLVWPTACWCNTTHRQKGLWTNSSRKLPRREELPQRAGGSETHHRS